MKTACYCTCGGQNKGLCNTVKDGISKTGDIDVVVYEKMEGNLLEAGIWLNLEDLTDKLILITIRLRFFAQAGITGQSR
jgi:hypothetical protein